MYWPGLLWMECKQMYNSGLRVYLLDNYNSIDYAVLSLYLASYTLRFLVDYKVAVADVYYNGTARARQALMDYNNISFFDGIRDEIFNDVTQPTYSYFMRACEYRITCGLSSDDVTLSRNKTTVIYLVLL